MRGMHRLAHSILSLVILLIGCGGRTADPITGQVDAGRMVDGAVSTDGFQTVAAPANFRILLFSRTVVFRHDSIPEAIAAFREMQSSGGFVAEDTEDPAQFTTDNLARFSVVVFLMTTGDVLDNTQQAAFEAWVNAGGGYLGVHSASDTEYGWPFYGQLVGAYFSQHPDIQTATVNIQTPTHPAVLGLPSPWNRLDEWYDFRTNPRGAVEVLATVDESSYSGGTMGADHPMVWAHATPSGARAFYTGMGHTKESYADPTFRQHLLAALRWVAGR
jgi:type 1 glutamine amidotransferase